MGCGRVGSSLAIELEAAGHTVSVIDQAREAFRQFVLSVGPEGTLIFLPVINYTLTAAITVILTVIAAVSV